MARHRARRQSDGWGLPLACTLEFYNITTRPARRIMSSARAAAFLSRLHQAGCQSWM
ncbi:MAG: hypothetical protein ACRD01_09405 [Terriglobales bacterium]